ncbi:hypothetical protein [Catenovulum sediminis]|uniref:hypothetical protein n=1 Tax=Catenovulum sediminis TaxID=1740262 RepID=UPI00117EFAD4|nr:hypothetical protein [Catenovulum sediminis]
MKFNQQNSFVFNGTYHRYRWFLTAIVAEDKTNYWHSANEILDPRPIEDICAILATHYSEPNKAIQLMKKGNILTLRETLKSSDVDNNYHQFSNQPDAYCIHQYNVHDSNESLFWQRKINFIEFTGTNWRSSLLPDEFFKPKNVTQFELGFLM